ncbi:hypothetical protein Tco_1411405 [Tanacetum coccineum]
MIDQSDFDEEKFPNNFECPTNVEYKITGMTEKPCKEQLYEAAILARTLRSDTSHQLVLRVVYGLISSVHDDVLKDL